MDASTPHMLLGAMMFGTSAFFTYASRRKASDDVKFEATLKKMQSEFPGALSNAELSVMVKAMLSQAGCKVDKTLLATSLCCDEVNRPLEKSLGAMFGSNHSMGGLAGFPFGGVSSFAAMLQHAPDDGSCLLVFGPHVGIDMDGKVGTVNRRGREKGGTCCGSGVAAAGYVAAVAAGDLKKSGAPKECLDAQQAYVGNMLLPHADRLESADDKMVELPYALYDAQDELTKEIVAKGASNLSGDGKVCVLGGIQINTPAGCSDYFLPISFDVFDNAGTLEKNLYQVPGRGATSKIAVSFPGALTNSALVDTLTDSLRPIGFDKKTTLTATALCSDEINRPLEKDLASAFGDSFFSMGGAAGFAFGGVTSFGAMAAHIPDGGNCLVVYGPHVGIDEDGKVGSIKRRGCSKSGPCCGHAMSAAVYVDGVRKGGVKHSCPTSPVDAQQTFMGDLLLPYGERLENAEEPMVELPYSLFDAQDELMEKILDKHFKTKNAASKMFGRKVRRAGAMSATGNFAVLGGIQINTPEGTEDYFMPMKFELRDSTGEVIEDLMESSCKRRRVN